MKTLVSILLFNCFNFLSLFGGHKITVEEATLILGESCYQTETESTNKSFGHQFKSTFTANSSSEKKSKTVALYYMFESYKDETSAKNAFAIFRESNEDSKGFELLNNLGDEAFFHTDNENFCLTIARKNNELIRLKVNKLTKKTSTSELKKVAENLLSRI
jgi:hypothetical protein